MKRCIVILFGLLTILFFPHLEALNREYDEWGSCYCFKHLTQCQLKESELTHELAQFFPTNNVQCMFNVTGRKYYCQNFSMYKGYVEFNFRKYRLHLKRHLEYCQKHTECLCYWPEYSEEAAQISDLAYLLFSDLIVTTALSKLIEDEDEQSNFIQCGNSFLNKHGLTLAFIARQLRFVDYYNVCRDIQDYAVTKYEEVEVVEIKEKLEDILEILYQEFFSLYNSCYKKHPNPEIDQEIRFMKLLVNDISGLEITEIPSKVTYSLPTFQKFYDINEYISANLQLTNIGGEIGCKGVPIAKKQTIKKPSYSVISHNLNRGSLAGKTMKASQPEITLQSNIFLEKGTLYNSLLLYKEAIQALTLAIRHNPSNQEAYIERAMAYFETNQISLA